MRFAQEFWLYLIPAVPALWLLARIGDRRARSRLSALLGPAAADHVEDANPRLRAWDRFLLAAGLVLLLLALARPQWGASEVTVTQKGSDVVIALDISNSMLAQDVAPSRLERAKADLAAFMQKLQNCRVGLVFFAGAAFVQCPLTLDYGTAEIFLNLAGPDMLSEQGTAIGAALLAARQLLGKDRQGDPGGTFQAVILVTDGEDQEGQWEEAARACVDDGIKLIAVGVGEPGGGLIPVQDAQGRAAGYMRDQDGSVVMTRLDMGFLEKLAAMSGGSPFRIGVDGLAGDRLFAELERLGRRDLQDRKVSAYQERFVIPLLAAVLCLGLRMLLHARATPGAAARRRVALAAAVSAVLAGGTAAQAGLASPLAPPYARAVEAGRRCYEQGDYQEAFAQFGSALALRPQDPRIGLAMGETLHRLQKYPQAVQEFERVASLTDDPQLRAEARYNAGTSLLAAGDAAGAVRQLRQALALDPEQADALRNLEIAQRLLEQQEQQDQDRKDQDRRDQGQDGQDKKDQDKKDQDEKDQNRQDGSPPQNDPRQQQQDQQQRQQEGRNQESPDRQAPDQQQPGQDEPQEQPRPQPGEDDAQQPRDAGDRQTPPQGQQEMTREQALQILKALDRDEQELRRSAQMRVKGGKPKSGKRW